MMSGSPGSGSHGRTSGNKGEFSAANVTRESEEKKRSKIQMEERVRLYRKVFGSVFKQRKKQKTKKTETMGTKGVRNISSL